MVLSVKDRVDMVKAAKHCAVCLHPNHTTDKCFSKDKDSHVCGVNGCGSHHHPSLHGSKDVYVTGVNALLRQRETAVTTVGLPDFVVVDNWFSRRNYLEDSYAAESSQFVANNLVKSKRELEVEEVKAELEKPLIQGDKVLMCMMSVTVVHGDHGDHSDIVGFFDDGSNCSVIKNEVAEKLGLWGHPITLELGTVNATTSIDTKLYCVELLDNSGKRHIIRAFGLKSLSGPLPVLCLNGIRHEFSEVVKRNWDKFSRPTGEVELLIRSEVAHLHPRHFETVGNMVVRKSIFGSGWVLNGAHEGIDSSLVEISRDVQVVRLGCFRSNRIVVSYKQDSINRVVSGDELSADRFFASESLGCKPARRCQDCLYCLDCGFRS